MVCLWLVAAVSAKLGATTFASVFDAFGLGYVVLLAGLVGGIAGAEEKQLGTHQSQLLQPVSARSQFLIKISVALAVTLTAGFLLVCVLNTVGLPWQDHDFVTLEWPFAASTAAITLWVFFVATQTSSGIRALVLGGPLGFATIVFVGAFDNAFVRLSHRRIRLPAWLQEPASRFLIDHHGLGAGLISGAFVVFTIGAFAFHNHRWPELRPATRAIQLLAIGGALIVALWFYAVTLLTVGL
jgi:hypothetical protein